MSRIRNTTAAWQADPATEAAIFLADSMGSDSSGGAFTRQELDGQRQLVSSDRLPSKIIGRGTMTEARAEFEALGFTFGDPDPDDPLFMPATLPDGWQREGSEHAMGSYVTDTLGRRRVSVFYKAAFYDRDANMSLISLDWYVTQAVEYDGPAVIFDDQWATREAVLASMAASRAAELAEAAEFRGFAADERGRDGENRRGCADIADRKEGVAALYEAAMKALTGSA